MLLFKARSVSHDCAELLCLDLIESSRSCACAVLRGALEYVMNRSVFGTRHVTQMLFRNLDYDILDIYSTWSSLGESSCVPRFTGGCASLGVCEGLLLF